MCSRVLNNIYPLDASSKPSYDNQKVFRLHQMFPGGKATSSLTLPWKQLQEYLLYAIVGSVRQAIKVLMTAAGIDGGFTMHR